MEVYCIFDQINTALLSIKTDSFIINNVIFVVNTIRWQVMLERVRRLSLTWEVLAPPLHPPRPLPLARWAGLLLQWPTHQITNNKTVTTTLHLTDSVKYLTECF